MAMSRYRFDASKVTHPEGRWLIASAAVLAIAIALGVVLSRLDLAVLNGWPIAVVAVGTGVVVAVLL